MADLLQGVPVVAPQKIDEAEHVEIVDSAMRGRPAERPKPAYDANQARQFASDDVRGRKIEAFHQVLERCGFKRVAPERLPPMTSSSGPRLQTEAKWMNLRDARLYPAVRLALTEDQILSHSWFPGGPEEFWGWYQTLLARAKAEAAGIFLPGDFRIDG